MSIPATVVYYVGYDYWRQRLLSISSGDNNILKDLSPLISGGLARGKRRKIINLLLSTFN
jgi:hypothetical protein